MKRKITAKWLNTSAETQAVPSKEGVDLMERTFGHVVESQKNIFHPVDSTSDSEQGDEKKSAKNAEDV